MRRGSVAVVGCGWLGLPLAEHLAARGYEVHGSTTRPDRLESLRRAGARAYLVRLPLARPPAAEGDPERTDGAAAATVDGAAARPPDDAALWACEQLVLTVPPGRRADAERTYPAAILSAVLRYRRAQPAGRIVFTSSTGVYDGLTGRVNERSPVLGRSPKSRKLALAESQVIAQSQRPHVVLRLGGLYGGERHPGRYLAGKRDVPDGDAPVNLASRERVVRTIAALLDHPFWRQPILNVVEPDHPTKRDYYGAYAREHGLPPPRFLAGGTDGKVVESLYPPLVGESGGPLT